ncbi:DUF1499 domain-containing protein [Chromatocurvus halotolerans]|uniref:Uncharacterized protein DUF1499 n=1 Tax=Chromatocurvus halotolerans TaxID=1132028 RepID=A0A4R2KXS4_9GAMM|nr:DUF1499 domain-containing protein [Chromatocurvus halotolerans]TCO76149.1 uncharacterized protein DUF1499 [Chromatocurvus halotolerans]
MNAISRAIRWPGYLAITLLLLIPIAILTVRSGNWQQGLMLYALACAASAILLLWFVVALVLPWFREQRGAVLGFGAATLPGALLLALVLTGSDVPPIHDITTDVTDPPRFSEAVVEARGERSNALDIDSDVIEQQMAAYPDLDTLVSETSIRETFERSEQIARELGWEIVNADLNRGRIEAVDTTTIMGFKDDVVIRVRSNADGTMVDLRSVSRVGVSDLGANADRIRAFRDAFRQG